RADAVLRRPRADRENRRDARCARPVPHGPCIIRPAARGTQDGCRLRTTRRCGLVVGRIPARRGARMTDLPPELRDLLALNLIPNLGPRLTAALLRHFGSAAAIRR